MHQIVSIWDNETSEFSVGRVTAPPHIPSALRSMMIRQSWLYCIALSARGYRLSTLGLLVSFCAVSLTWECHFNQYTATYLIKAPRYSRLPGGGVKIHWCINVDVARQCLSICLLIMLISLFLVFLLFFFVRFVW